MIFWCPLYLKWLLWKPGRSQQYEKSDSHASCEMTSSSLRYFESFPQSREFCKLAHGVQRLSALHTEALLIIKKLAHRDKISYVWKHGIPDQRSSGNWARMRVYDSISSSFLGFGKKGKAKMWLSKRESRCPPFLTSWRCSASSYSQITSEVEYSSTLTTLLALIEYL